MTAATRWLNPAVWAFPPAAPLALVLIVCGLLLVGFALWSRSSTRWTDMAFGVYLVAATLAVGSFGGPWPLERAALAVAFVALLASRRGSARPDSDSMLAGPSGSRTSIALLLVPLAIGAPLLLVGLEDHPGTLLTWESAVIFGFSEAYQAGTSLFGYVLQCLRWDDGLVSRGHLGFLYGPPTYALFHVFGFSEWMLRIVAVADALAAVAVAWAFARRSHGPRIAIALAFLLVLDPVLLFYGRYGTSLAATILAVLLALWTASRFVEEEPPKWWRAPLCGLTLFVATLHYSPARIIVLVLMGWILACAVLQRSRWSINRVFGVAVLLASAAGVWALERHFGVEHLFLEARGEQYFTFIIDPGWLSERLGEPTSPRTLTWRHHARLLRDLVGTTAGELASVLLPESDPLRHGRAVLFDPPRLPLYLAPLAGLITLGLARSISRWREPRHASLLLWLFGGAAPLLLTNRIDVHRASLLVVPLLVWAAIGAVEALERLRRAGTPAALRHAAVLAAVVAMVRADVDLLYPSSPTPPAAGRVLAKHALGAGGNVAVWSMWDHRDVGWARIRLLERERLDPSFHFEILPFEALDPLRDIHGPPDRDRVERLASLVRGGTTLVLSPVSELGALRRELQTRGLRIDEVGPPGLAVLIVH